MVGRSTTSPASSGGQAPRLTTRQRLALENREARRVEIMRGAAELFEANGYFETSVGDIAELLGMSKAAIYHYFTSKEEILFAIHDAFTARLIAEHEAARARTEDPLEQLHALFQSFFAVTSDARPQVRAFFSHFDDLKGDYRREIEARRQVLSDTMEALIATAIARGELREVDARLAMLCISGIFNWAPFWYRPGGPKSPRELADFVFELVIDGLRPRASLEPT